MFLLIFFSFPSNAPTSLQHRQRAHWTYHPPSNPFCWGKRCTHVIVFAKRVKKNATNSSYPSPQIKKKERFLHPPSSHTPTQAHRLMKRCILLPMCASVCMHVYVGLPALAGIFFPSWSMSSFAARLIPAHNLHPSPPLFRTKGCACACMCVPFLCAVGMPPTAYRLTSQRHGLRAPTLSYVFCGSYQTLLFSTTHTSTPTMCRSSSSLRLYLSSAALLREGRPQPTPFCIT